MFSSEPRKSQIVPVLPAASREAGRTVTAAETTQKKSGMTTSVRPAVQSGPRPAIQSGLQQALNTSNAPTLILPRIDSPEKRLDGRTIALILLSGLLVINMAATTLLLFQADRANPDLIEQKVQIQFLQEELAKLRMETEKNLSHASSVVNQLQLDSNMLRGQVHVINQKSVEATRSAGASPHDPVQQQ